MVISPQIRDECIKVSSEIPSAVFVGAAATLAHLGWGYRRTGDLDIAVEFVDDADEGKLNRLQYRKDPFTGTWYTPRGWKIDIYRKDVSGFSTRQIGKDAVTISARKARFRVVRLEMLILMKHRAQRYDDIRALMQRKFNSIDWSYLESIAADKVEAEEMRNVARVLRLL